MDLKICIDLILNVCFTIAQYGCNISLIGTKLLQKIKESAVSCSYKDRDKYAKQKEKRLKAKG